MIVTREEDGLALVTQVEHGRVAGELAGRWGNAIFQAPAPQESVVFAARHHDEGWRSRDALPLLNAVEQRPLHFLEIDADEHVRLYQEGVERVRLGDLYAGVLVGMHWTGLYRGRWSRPGARGRLGGSEGDEELLDDVVVREEHRRVEQKLAVWTAEEPRAVFEASLWHNYELLQFFDLISLYLCVMPQEPVLPGETASPWGPQLGSLVHSPQPVSLPPVRTGTFGESRPVRASVEAPGTVTVDPWPFDKPVFTVEVERTMVPDTAYQDCAMAAHAIAGGQRLARVWTMRAPTAPDRGTHDA